MQKTFDYISVVETILVNITYTQNTKLLIKLFSKPMVYYIKLC